MTNSAQTTCPTPESFLLGCLTDATPDTPYTVAELRRSLSGLVYWHVATTGGVLTREVVLGRCNIVRYVEGGMSEFKVATRTNRRCQLLRVAEALLGPELAPRALPALAPSDPCAPYSVDEVAALTGCAKSVKKPHRTDAAVLLALGLGAGLSAQEIMSVRAGDVLAGPDGVRVRVAEGRSRTVTVLRRWEAAIARRAAGASAAEFLFKPGRSSAGKNLISNFVANNLAGGVHVQTQRMRATWLVTQMAACTSLPVLAEAAGVDSLEALTRYLKFVPTGPSAQAAASLRSARPLAQ